MQRTKTKDDNTMAILKRCIYKVKTNDIAVGKVYRTIDYAKFKTLKGNREISESWVKGIEDSISEIGFRGCPICVNKHFEIINGQHRLEACRQLGIPVDYVFDAEAGRKEMQFVNTSQHNWRYINYVDSFAAYGLKEFVTLKRLCDKFMGVVVFDAITMSCGMGQYKNGDHSVKDGTFKLLRPLKDVEADLEMLYRVCDGYRNKKRGAWREFQQAALFAMTCKNADKRRLEDTLRKIMVSPDYAILASTMKLNIDEIEKAYNKNLREDKRVYFSDEWARTIGRRGSV